MTNWKAIWAVFAGGLVAAAFITKVAPAIPALRDQLGLTLVESGLIATMFNVMGMAIGMVAGMFCDRYGRKRLALFGLVTLALGSALGALADGFALLLAARFLEGVGFIVVVVSAPALMAGSAANPKDRAKALGLWSAYMPTGGTIALLAAPPLIAAWGWRGVWVALALVSALVAVVFARVVPPSSPAQVSSMRLVVESLQQKGNLVMGLLFAFYVAQWTSVMIWLPTFLIDEYGASTGTAAMATALMVIVNAPGNMTGSWLVARGVPHGRLVVTVWIAAALLEVAMYSEALPPGLRFGCVLVFSYLTGLVPGSIFASLPAHAKTPQHIATGNGIVMQASQAGQFLGPLALAWIASRFGGWQPTLWLMLAFAAGGVLCGIAIGAISRGLPRR